MRFTRRERKNLSRAELNHLTGCGDLQPACEQLDEYFTLGAMVREKSISLEHEEDDGDRPATHKNDLSMTGDWRVWLRAQPGGLSGYVDFSDSRCQTLPGMLAQSVARAQG